VAILGNAAGTTSRAYEEFFPETVVDGVEIDAELSDIGREYFDMNNPRLRLHHEDARPWLRRTDDRFDVISVDAYRQPYIPFYLATKEFFELARDRLEPGGVLALNVARVPGDDRLSRAIGSTLRAVFPQAWVWKPLRFNELMLGFDRPTTRARVEERVGQVDPQLASLVPLFRQDLRPVEQVEEPLTDDRAPVEWLTDQMIVDYIAEGGAELDEDYLPTAP
jgi:hypothetical protein